MAVLSLAKVQACVGVCSAYQAEAVIGKDASTITSKGVAVAQPAQHFTMSPFK